MIKKNIEARQEFLRLATEKLGNSKNITRQQILKLCEEYNIQRPNWLTNDPRYRHDKGVYLFNLAIDDFLGKDSTTPIQGWQRPMKEKQIESDPVAIVQHSQCILNYEEYSLIPHKAQGYVPFGHFNDVRSIIKSKKFYPIFITGLSGNGKTMMVEQACAFEKRECIRANITIETDEDDLLGGFRLIDGKTVWHNGPAITAMQRGAILLLDEIDLGSNRLMCLQPILEGKQVFLKKINKVVSPAPGFSIIATANTKGKGSDDGRFIGTNIMNEAFLERFSITLEQEYPVSKIETKILNNILAAAGSEDKPFTDYLVRWAEIIRKSFMDGSVSEIISTRRLVHICEAYNIFSKDREKAIQLCLNRFDTDTKLSFIELYKKIDPTIVPVATTVADNPIVTENLIEKDKELISF